MKSKANFKSHPVHPMVIPFPIVLFISAFIFDVINFVNNEDYLAITGRYLLIAGLCAGVVAAVPGIIDYAGTVPPNSSAKKRAAKHGLINLTVLILFGVALLLRPRSNFQILVLVLELTGVVLLFISGWLGGTLVYRNQIGVDVRYAGAGKWKEQNTSAEAGEIEVATTSELKVNQMKLIHVGTTRIVLARTESGYTAFADRCSHKGGSLAGGAMICDTVQCPWHGSQFDVRTGAVKAGPASDPILTYPLKEENGKVFLIYQSV